MKIQTEKIKVKIIEIGPLSTVGLSVGNNLEYIVTKTTRINNLQLGSIVEGYVLYDEERDEFFVEAIQ